MTGVNVERARASHHISLDPRCTDKQAAAELLVAAGLKPSRQRALMLVTALLRDSWLIEQPDGRYGAGPTYEAAVRACRIARLRNIRRNAIAPEPPIGSVVLFRRVSSPPWDPTALWATWKRWPTGWTEADVAGSPRRYPVQWATVQMRHRADHRLIYATGKSW